MILILSIVCSLTFDFSKKNILVIKSTIIILYLAYDFSPHRSLHVYEYCVDPLHMCALCKPP